MDALIEAIQVIRGVWAGGSLTVSGEHYGVKGLHAGPAPAHDVEIWLGAYKPRMVRVTGELADGWIPSMGYADPPALAGMNAVIDGAAVASGRGPEDVRRMYNIFGRFGSGSGFLQGTPNNWAEQLAALALEAGISTFILGTDQADDLRRFAAEVVPETRALVERERGRAADGPSLGSQPERESPAVVTAAPAYDRLPMAVTPTPDDGRRLTGELAWHEPSRPTAPQPSNAAYTLEQQAHPQHLIDIHDQLRAELQQLRTVVDQVLLGHLGVEAARSTLNTMTMRQNNWTLEAYCESYCRIVTAQRSIDLLTDTLISHLAYEERELLHPLAQHGLN